MNVVNDPDDVKAEWKPAGARLPRAARDEREPGANGNRGGRLGRPGLTARRGR
jgi:hypothetical protein